VLGKLSDCPVELHCQLEVGRPNHDYPPFAEFSPTSPPR
jgi:hypothetical protein